MSSATITTQVPIVYEDGTTLMAKVEEPVRQPLTPEQVAAENRRMDALWKQDAARFGIPRQRIPRAARITSALRPVRRVAHARRTGAVVARRRTAGTGKPCARGSGDSEPGEPSGPLARAPSTPSAPPFMPAIAAGTLSFPFPKETTR
jgi:hypothetical protein